MNDAISIPAYSSDANLEFLNKKILQACGFCCIESDEIFLKTPIVETEKIDDKGNIYFLIPQPQEDTQVKNSIVNITYAGNESKYRVKIQALAQGIPTHLKIIYSFGQCKMEYLKIEAKILRVEYVEVREPVIRIKNILNNLSKNIAMLFY